MTNDPQASIFPGAKPEVDRAPTWGTCGCWTCVSEFLTEREGENAILFMPFIVCPSCGNKRCPKATRHDQACSGSNEPGQVGSRYA